MVIIFEYIVIILFFYGLFVFCCVLFYKVNREFFFGRVFVVRCTFRKYFVVKFCVVNSFFLGLCKVAGIS